jgi:hypothetical protein
MTARRSVTPIQSPAQGRRDLAACMALVESLAVVGPLWILPPLPDWRTAHAAQVKTPRPSRQKHRHITINGRTQTLTEWATETGQNYRKIAQRIDSLGWSDEEAVTGKRKHRRKWLGRKATPERSIGKTWEAHD